MPPVLLKMIPADSICLAVCVALWVTAKRQASASLRQRTAARVDFSTSSLSSFEGVTNHQFVSASGVGHQLPRATEKVCACTTPGGTSSDK